MTAMRTKVRNWVARCALPLLIRWTGHRATANMLEFQADDPWLLFRCAPTAHSRDTEQGSVIESIRRKHIAVDGNGKLQFSSVELHDGRPVRTYGPDEIRERSKPLSFRPSSTNARLDHLCFMESIAQGTTSSSKSYLEKVRRVQCRWTSALRFRFLSKIVKTRNGSSWKVYASLRWSVWWAHFN